MTLYRILAERMTVPESAQGRESPGRIFVRDLVLTCSIGVHPHEHETPQRVRINADMWTAESPAPINDDIANVVSYEDIVSGIEAYLGRGHISLIETAAKGIAELCLEDSRVVKVRVCFEKLDVFSNAASAGVEIECERSETNPAAAFQAKPSP